MDVNIWSVKSWDQYLLTRSGVDSSDEPPKWTSDFQQEMFWFIQVREYFLSNF